MGLKEDLVKNDIIILIVPKKDVSDKLVEVNQLAKTNSKVSVMVLNKANLDNMGFCKYCHNVISQVRIAGLKGIFICVKEDFNQQIIEDLKMFADKVKEVE